MRNIKQGTAATLGALALVVSGAALAADRAVTPSDTPRYDARAEYAVKGKVAAVKIHDSVLGYKDAHIILTTVQGDMEVHVGPVAYLAKRGFEVVPGDEVLVIGCKTMYEDKPVLVARQIKRGDRSLTLRNVRGNPVWPKRIT